MNKRFTYTSVAALSAAILMLSACGGGEEDDDISNAAGSSATCNSATYPDTMGYTARLSKYKNDGQCSPLVQAAEAWRQSAIASCQAGNASAATTSYSNYQKSVTQVNGFCPR